MAGAVPKGSCILFGVWDSLFLCSRFRVEGLGFRIRRRCSGFSGLNGFKGQGFRVSIACS